MTDPESREPRAERSQEQLAVEELRQRQLEVRRRLGSLGDQHRALEEVRDLLADEAAGVADRLQAASAQSARFEERIRALHEQLNRGSAESAGCEREIAMLRRRSEEIDRAERSLDADVASMGHRLRSSREWMMSATAELEMGRVALSRMDRKLIGKWVKR